MIRRLLSQRYPDRRTGYHLPRKLQVYFWQLSVLFLAISVLAMFTGMFILIWSGTAGYFLSSDWWNDDAKLAVTFTVCFAIVAGLFLAENISLYS